MGGLKIPPSPMPHKLGFTKLILNNLDFEGKLNGLEIGTFEGEFTAHMLRLFPKLRMTIIERYPNYELVIKNVLSPYADRVRFIHADSTDAHAVIRDSFDFIFIDGDHSYEQCRLDILNYSGMVKVGGLIAGHNYHKDSSSAHPGVHQSVDEIYGDQVKLEKDFIWYVQKQE